MAAVPPRSHSMRVFLSDSLRGHSSSDSIPIVLANLTRNPSVLPAAIIASQTLFFGVQAIAAWKQLRFMDTPAYRSPVGLDLSAEDAKVHPLRIRQSLVTHLLEQATWCSITIAQSLGGWNIMWNISLSAGRWFERRFRSNNGHLVANPVFFILDYVTSLIASSIVRSLYLAYAGPQIYPDTASLSFPNRLKRHILRPWNSNTRKMWFYKTLIPYLLPLTSLVPGIVVATNAQYRYERGSSRSLRTICWELFKLAMLNLSLTGIIGASIPFLFFKTEKPVDTQDEEDLPAWAVEQCAISDLRDRGVRLKGVESGKTIELSEVEAMVRMVANDTAYEGELNISMRLDTHLSGKNERALAFVPRLFLGTLTLSQQQFALLTDTEMRSLIATALLPGFQFPFNVKNYILMFFTSALPLLVDPLMYCFFRRVPHMFREIVPSLQSEESLLPLSVSLVVTQALIPWVTYPLKKLLGRIQDQTYRDDKLIASLSPDYANGWFGVLSKHTVLNALRKGEDKNVHDYGKVDAFFEFWFASYGKTMVQPPLLQRLERIQQFER